MHTVEWFAKSARRVLCILQDVYAKNESNTESCNHGCAISNGRPTLFMLENSLLLSPAYLYHGIIHPFADPERL